MNEQQDKMDKAKAMLQRVWEDKWTRRNIQGVPASYQAGDWVLVHHIGLPAWPRSTSVDPYFGSYRILTVDGHRITVRWSFRLGGTLVCAAQQLKHYYNPEELCGEERALNDEEIATVDLPGPAGPMEDKEHGREGEVPNKNREEMAKEVFYMVKSIPQDRYCPGWQFLSLWEGLGVQVATCETLSAFVLPEGCLNSVLVDYSSQNNLGDLLRLAETLASQKQPRD